MSIMELNGGSVIAMVGKDCVAIASDLRLGNQALGISSNFQKIFPITDRIYLGLPGLATDVTTLRERFRFRVNMYTIKEEREIEPETFAHLVSSTLYEHRFGPYFIEPVIAGLSKTPAGGLKPFIAATDLIGCLNFAKDFVVAGTASSKLFGVAEGLWEPDLEPEDLFETISQTLLNAVDRDAYSGWGAVVHVITKDKVITRTLKVLRYHDARARNGSLSLPPSPMPERKVGRRFWVPLVLVIGTVTSLLFVARIKQRNHFDLRPTPALAPTVNVRRSSHSSFQDFASAACPPGKLKIHNSPENLYFQARFIACANVSTAYCFIQDDDYFIYPEIIHAMRARISALPEATAAIHLLPPHEHLSSSLRTILTSPSSSRLHTSFAWLGHGALIPRSRAPAFLELMAQLGMSDAEMKMADNFWSVLANSVPEVWFDQGVELGGGTAFTVGTEGEERNRRFITRAGEYLDAILRDSLKGIERLYTHTAPVLQPPKNPIAHAACLGVPCVLSTNIALLPGNITRAAQSATEMLALETSNLALLGPALQAHYVAHPPSAAVDGQAGTAFCSPGGARAGDTIALDLLVPITQGGWRNVEMVWLVDRRTEALLRGSAWESSVDGIQWIYNDEGVRCIDTDLSAAGAEVEGGLRECSVPFSPDANSARAFRARLRGDGEGGRGWCVYELWMRGAYPAYVVVPWPPAITPPPSPSHRPSSPYHGRPDCSSYIPTDPLLLFHIRFLHTMILNVAKRAAVPALRAANINAQVVRNISVQNILHGSPEAREAGDLESQQHSKLVARGKYLHGFEIHKVKPDQSEAYKKAAEGYYAAIKDDPALHVKLSGSWETIVGEQDTFLHILEYENYKGYDKTTQMIRDSPHAAAYKAMLPFLNARSSQLTQEFAFFPTAPPHEEGGIFELRSYQLKAGALLEWEHAWRSGIEARRKFVEPVGAWFSQVGRLHQVHHLWQYPDLATRKETREKAWQVDGWAETVSKTSQMAKFMDSFIMSPLPFSPLK
ncbi:hypothetical protein HWV62_39479 [Athelia sp. TMB]|nr:hypothetical protein HWV62_39479 [Athelia sp. TMB]